MDCADCTLMKMIENNNIAVKGFLILNWEGIQLIVVVIIFQTKLSLSAQPDPQNIAIMVFCHVVFELLFFLIDHKYA